jgi:hypothetical protein
LRSRRYAQKLFGPNSKGGEIGHDNALVQLDLVCVPPYPCPNPTANPLSSLTHRNLDIALEEMALRGVMIESIPSILVFFVEIVSARNRPLNTLMLSIVNALVSVVLIGRKSYLPNRKKEMKTKKGDLEETLRGMKGSGRKSSVRGSQKLLAGVFGGAAAAATEGLMEERVGAGAGGTAEELRDVEAASEQGAAPESRSDLRGEVARLNAENSALREEIVGLRKRGGGLGGDVK